MIKTNLEQNATIINEYANRLYDSAVDFVNDCISYDFESSEYICDAISEFADNNTSIYYYDIMQFIAHNPEALSEAVAEFGIDSRNFDIYKLGQQAEFLTIEKEIYNDLDDIIVYAALKYADSIGVNLCDKSNLELIVDAVSIIDSNDMVCSISEAVDEALNIEI